MARLSAFLLALLVASALVPAALASKPRRLNYYGSPTPVTPSPKSSSPVVPVTPPTPYTSPTPKSGSSPVVPSPSTPYSSPTPKSGSSPNVPSPSTPYSPTPKSGSSPSGPSPSGPSPYVTPPTTPSGPSPVTPTPSSPSPLSSPSPITQTPSGGYGGYGSRSGTGSSKYWGEHPWKAPKLLSLLSTIVKIFGPRALKLFGNRKTLFGALKDVSPDSMSALAREGTASLLNSYSVVGFPLSTENVLMLFDSGLNSEDAALQQAMLFQQFNDAV